MFLAKTINVLLGGKHVLHDVDFRAEAGQVTAIVGPNGSGKTTLLRALTGEIPYSGVIRIGDRNVAHQKPRDLAACRAVLPQSTRIAFPFTVLEVVRLGLLAGATVDNRELPQLALERVGLAGFEGRYYHELSGGEQQRTQLARVLLQVWDPVVDGLPRWLLLDEPVSSLDIGHQLEVMRLARDFAAKGGGVIAVMHDLNLTAMFADSVALLCNGRKIAQDHPQHLLSEELLRPAYNCPVRLNTLPSQNDMRFMLPQAVDSS